MHFQEKSLAAGGNTPLTHGKQAQVRIQWAAGMALDVSCFLVNESGRVPSDDYMVFYNQIADPRNVVRYASADGTAVTFQVDLAQLQASGLSKCVFTATVDGGGTMRACRDLIALVECGEERVRYQVMDLGEEKSLVIAELYLHQGTAKVRAVGRGFFGGLKPLAEAHGVEVADEDADAGASAAANAGAGAVASQGPSAAASPAPQSLPPRIDLLKKKVMISLEKKQISGEKARVAIVIDASGSMTKLYTNGTVQRTFERILAVASCLDDDGMLDVWFFGHRPMRAPSVRAQDYENYVARVYPKPRSSSDIGAGNNEPAVMEDVLKKYTREEPSKHLPTYVIFISDGGVYMSKAIEKILRDCSNKNVFWQFVGIGRADYGILAKLDNLSGRVIDNAGFFALDDIDKITDEELYSRLLEEFPSWLKEARRIGIL